MARKNTVKKFIENGYYHIYNRGIEGREIFLDSQDYTTFLSVAKRYLAPIESESRAGYKAEKPSLASHKARMNLSDQVTLVCYCLMSNHFHLLIKQNQSREITKFMRRLCTNYSMYFNSKYGRRGSLFESIYKAVLIDSENQLIHLTRYIHLNPVNIKITRFGPVAATTTVDPRDYEYSSYSKYLNGAVLPWFNPTDVLRMFNRDPGKFTSYRSFVEDHKVDSLASLGPLVLESEA